jgi:hypothetical protein
MGSAKMAGLDQTDYAMPIGASWPTRLPTCVDVNPESRCANCGWFTDRGAVDSTATCRGTCHRYDCLSTEKSPRVLANDWCFDHRPKHDVGAVVHAHRGLPHSRR